MPTTAAFYPAMWSFRPHFEHAPPVRGGHESSRSRAGREVEDRNGGETVGEHVPGVTPPGGMEDAQVGADVDPLGIFGVVEHRVDGMVGQVAGTVPPGAAAVGGLEDVSGPEAAGHGIRLVGIVGMHRHVADVPRLPQPQLRFFPGQAPVVGERDPVDVPIAQDGGVYRVFVGRRRGDGPDGGSPGTILDAHPVVG